jgi:hypothetical protein
MAFTNSCLYRAEGNQEQADYLFNCSYFEYYYRMVAYNKYVERKNDEAKEAMGKK